MEKWFDGNIIEELKKSPASAEELQKRFNCEKDILVPTLIDLEKRGKIKMEKNKYFLK